MLKMYQLALKISRHTKKASEHYKTPLYKPVRVSIGGMELEPKVLDVLHSLHKSAIYLLGTNDEVSAHVITHYFDTYLMDMEKMDDIKNDIKRSEGGLPWDM
jgi:hypothetical protein